MKTLKTILSEARQRQYKKYGDVQHAQTIAQNGEDARVQGSRYKPGGWDKIMTVASRKDSIRSLKAIRKTAGQDYDKRLPEEVIYEDAPGRRVDNSCRSQEKWEKENSSDHYLAAVGHLKRHGFVRKTAWSMPGGSEWVHPSTEHEYAPHVGSNERYGEYSVSDTNSHPEISHNKGDGKFFNSADGLAKHLDDEKNKKSDHPAPVKHDSNATIDSKNAHSVHRAFLTKKYGSTSEIHSTDHDGNAITSHVKHSSGAHIEFRTLHSPNGELKKYEDKIHHYDKRLPEEVIYEMTDDEIDDRFNDKVVVAHCDHIEKKYGRKVAVNHDCFHDEKGEHGVFTSEVCHPKRGNIYVTTHYNTKTHEVSHHSEE